MEKYYVNVGNVGNIPCEDLDDAKFIFNEYVNLSKLKSGRAAGEDVCIMKDDEILHGYEYFSEHKD